MVGPAFLVNLSLRVKQALEWEGKLVRGIAWESWDLQGAHYDWNLKWQRNCGRQTDCRVRHQRGQGTKVLARCWSRDIPGSTYSCISRLEACYLLLTGVKNSEWRGIWWRKTGRDLGPVILNHFCLANSYFSLNFFFFSSHREKIKLDNSITKPVNLLFIKNISEQSARFYQTSPNWTNFSSI